jgi:hypothetical protein
VVGCCEHGNETVTLYELQGTSRLAEELLAFQEGLGCFEVGRCMLLEKEFAVVLFFYFCIFI